MLPKVHQRLLLAAIIGVIVGVFLFDLNVALGVAGGVPYVLPLLLCLGLRWRGAILLCGAIVSLLILTGYLLSPAAPAESAITSTTILANRGLALFAVAATVLLGYTQRRAADRSIADRRFVTAILDTTDALVVVIDRAGRIIRCNRACERLAQTSSDMLTGQPLVANLPAEQRQGFRDRMDEAWTRNEPYRTEQHWCTASGDRRLIAWSNTPLPDADGGGRYMVCTGIDISDERAALERARRMQNDFYRIGRVYELGGMASAIAHELVQPLTAVNNYLRLGDRLLQRRDDDSRERARHLLDEARQQAERGASIVQRLRQLMSRGESEMSRIDLNAAIREACELALLDVDELAIEVRMALADALPEVRADATQIQQVVINLARNGVDALREAPRREFEIRSQRCADGGAEVRVTDTGPGLPSVVLDNLFMPFHSTKPQGTGIGLAICRSIVNAHGGRIWTEPAAGGGTAFAFVLPPAPPAEAMDA